MDNTKVKSGEIEREEIKRTVTVDIVDYKPQKVEIKTCGSQTLLLIDGKPLEGVYKVTFNSEVGGVPHIKFEMYAKNCIIDMDGVLFRNIPTFDINNSELGIIKE